MVVLTVNGVVKPPQPILQYSMAAAVLIEVLSLADVVPEIAEAFTGTGEWAEIAAEERAFNAGLAPPTGGWRFPTLKEAIKGTFGIAGAIGLNPAAVAVAKALKKKHRTRNIHHTHAEDSFITPAKPPGERPTADISPHTLKFTTSSYFNRKYARGPVHRSISTGRRSMPGAKRKAYRQKKSGRGRKHRKVHGNFALKHASVHKPQTKNNTGRNHIISKIVDSIPPTGIESGGTITNIVTNKFLKTTATGAGGIGFSYKLSDFPAYADYAKIYQYYKILWCKCTFMPMQTIFGGYTIGAESDQGNVTAIRLQQPAQMVVAPDMTSDAAFTSFGVATSHDKSTFVVFNGAEEFTAYVAPSPLAVEGDSGSEVNVPGNQIWIPTDSNAVKHYGLRCYFRNLDQYSQIGIIHEMKVAFRGLKV